MTSVARLRWTNERRSVCAILLIVLSGWRVPNRRPRGSGQPVPGCPQVAADVPGCVSVGRPAAIRQVMATSPDRPRQPVSHTIADDDAPRRTGRLPVGPGQLLSE